MATISERTRMVVTIPLRLLQAPVTVAREVRRVATEPGTLSEARQAFLEDLRGRVKSLTGFVLGDDRLLARGMLERAKAVLRLQAMTEEALAEGTERRAGEAMAARTREAERKRHEATTRHAQRTASTASKATAEKREVEQRAAAERDAVRRRAQAERVAINVTDASLEDQARAEATAAAAAELGAEEAQKEAEHLERVRRGEQ